MTHYTVRSSKSMLLLLLLLLTHFSRVRLLSTPWTAAHQAPPSMRFSKKEYWSGVPLPSLKCFLVTTKKSQFSFDQGFPGSSWVKNPPAHAGDVGSIPGSGRCPEEGNSNPLQYFCLGIPMVRGAWCGRKESDTTEQFNK